MRGTRGPIQIVKQKETSGDRARNVGDRMLAAQLAGNHVGRGSAEQVSLAQVLRRIQRGVHVQWVKIDVTGAGDQCHPVVFVSGPGAAGGDVQIERSGTPGVPAGHIEVPDLHDVDGVLLAQIDHQAARLLRQVPLGGIVQPHGVDEFAQIGSGGDRSQAVAVQYVVFVAVAPFTVLRRGRSCAVRSRPIDHGVAEGCERVQLRNRVRGQRQGPVVGRHRHLDREAVQVVDVVQIVDVDPGNGHRIRVFFHGHVGGHRRQVDGRIAVDGPHDDRHGGRVIRRQTRILGRVGKRVRAIEKRLRGVSERTICIQSKGLCMRRSRNKNGFHDASQWCVVIQHARLRGSRRIQHPIFVNGVHTSGRRIVESRGG